MISTRNSKLLALYSFSDLIASLNYEVAEIYFQLIELKFKELETIIDVHKRLSEEAVLRQMGTNAIKYYNAFLSFYNKKNGEMQDDLDIDIIAGKKSSYKFRYYFCNILYWQNSYEDG